MAGCEATTALLPRRSVQRKEESWGIVLPAEVAEEEPGGSEKLSILVSEGTSHQISTDPWYQVGFILTTGINSSYVLGYSRSIMVPLGWIFGTAGLLLAAAISLYANSLVAHLHEVGGRRQIRYRDLTGHVYGRKMYGLTWALQYVNLFMINTGYIILAGKALKALYVLYRDDGILKLPYCIGIAGIICALFAFGIPHLSALRIWLGFSTLFSIVYIIIAFVLSLSDGNPHQTLHVIDRYCSSCSIIVANLVLINYVKICCIGMTIALAFSLYLIIHI